MKRATLALIVILGISVGLGGGLLYTWVLDPVEYYDSSPDALHLEDKFVYLVIIGDLYAYEGDLEKAERRLADLDIEADGQVVADLTEQYLDNGGQPHKVRNLARLAQDLGASGGVLLVFDSAPTPLLTSTPTVPAPADASPTPPPTTTPVPTFRLVEQTAVCAEPGRPGRIMIWVRDAAGNDMPGVEIVVSWPLVQDRFFTGLRPAQGLGYADFEMVPETEYEVTLAGFPGGVARDLTSDLSPGICPTGTRAIDWQLTFQRTE